MEICFENLFDFSHWKHPYPEDEGMIYPMIFWPFKTKTCMDKIPFNRAQQLSL